MLLFAVQPNLANASSCFDEMQDLHMMQQTLPCHHDLQSKNSSHHQNNQMTDCCNLGLTAWSFSSSPKLYKPFNQSIHAINIINIYDGLKLDVLKPPPRHS